MAYKLMYDEDYETEDGASVTIPVEYDGISYDSVPEAWLSFCSSKNYAMMAGYRVYVKEVGDKT